MVVIPAGTFYTDAAEGAYKRCCRDEVGADGSTAATNQVPVDYYPRFSPDGSRVVYFTERFGAGEIMTVSVAGGDARRLTDDDHQDYHPAWSPDGRRIAHFSIRDGQSDLFVIDLTTGLQQRITSHPGNDYTPDWSPDGEKLVFYREEEGSQLLITLDLATGRERVIADNLAYDPAWSPRGDLIAFGSNRDSVGDIYLVEPNGERERKLVHLPGRQGGLSWTADGTALLFESDHEGDGVHEGNHDPDTDIYMIDIETGSITPIIRFPGAADMLGHPSPDGKKLTFASRRSGSWTIYMANLDGSEVTRLTR